MKKEKAQQLRELAPEELNRRLLDLRKKFLELKFKRAANQIKNPLELRAVKRNIARILTVLNEMKGKIKGEA